MTVDQFTASAIALLRSSIGWQTAIARRLDIEPRTVRRWIAAGEIPGWVDAKLSEIIGRTDAAPWPRDEWIFGDASGGDGKRREYIVHAVAPRFIARVVMVDDAGSPLHGEEPADIVSGVVYSSDDFLLAEIDWIDQPRPGEVAKLLDAAADAVDRQE